MTLRSPSSPDRGVSDLVGFALLLGIVITAIFFTFAIGFDTLFSLGETQTVDQNTESMDAVQTTLDTVASTSVRTKETTPTWTATSLTVNQTPVTISIESAELGINRSFETALFRSDEAQTDTQLVYALGAVYTVSQQSGLPPQAVAEIPPNFAFTQNETSLVIPVIDGLRPGSPTAVGTDTTADQSVRAVQTGSQSITRRSGQPTQLTVNVTSTQYPQLWESLFRQTGVSQSNLKRSSTGVTATVNTSRVSLFTSTVELYLGS